MSTIRDMFCNDSIHAQVVNTTKAIKKQHEEQLALSQYCTANGYLDSCGFVSYLSVVDYSDSPKIFPANIFTATETAILTPAPQIQFNPLGYSMPQGSMLCGRQRLLNLLRAAGYKDSDFLDPNMDVRKLEDWGLMTQTPTEALAIHAVWICKGISKPYYGNVPLTEPVRKFFKVFFRNGNPSQADGNKETFKIAEEVGKDPIYVNYAMWVMGRII